MRSWRFSGVGSELGSESDRAGAQKSRLRAALQLRAAPAPHPCQKIVYRINDRKVSLFERISAWKGRHVYPFITVKTKISRTVSVREATNLLSDLRCDKTLYNTHRKSERLRLCVAPLAHTRSADIALAKTLAFSTCTIVIYYLFTTKKL